MDDANESPEGHRLSRKGAWIFAGFVMVTGYFLVMEHRAHLEGALSYLPFLLLLACPLMHVFMHHGHGGHREHTSQADNRKGKQ